MADCLGFAPPPVWWARPPRAAANFMGRVRGAPPPAPDATLLLLSQTPLLARPAEQKHWLLYGGNLIRPAGGRGGRLPVAPSQAQGDFG